MQASATAHNITVDFERLEKAIHKIGKASKKFDKSKAHAAHKLEKALDALRKYEKGKHRNSDVDACARRSWPKARELIKSVFGVKSSSNTRATDSGRCSLP